MLALGLLSFLDSLNTVAFPFFVIGLTGVIPPNSFLNRARKPDKISIFGLEAF